MKFTLFYSGTIRSSNKKNVNHINEIRCGLSPQIRLLYDYEPLSGLEAKCEPGEYPEQSIRTFLNVRNRSYSCLVNRGFGLACIIHFTFFESSGSLSVASDIGDLDNKVKTLIDALRVPAESEVDVVRDSFIGHTVHCLLMDDSYIWEIQVERKRLLHPEFRKQRTLAQIDVEVIPRKVTIANLGLFGVPVF